MKDWAQGRVTAADGVSLRYLRSRGAHPPLVLVHGFTDNALYFTRVADALAHRWDVVAYDSRGHGQSDRAGGRFSDDERVSDLLSVIDHLRLDRPALLGHSMGAATIARAVAQRRVLSRGVVLEDPAWWELPSTTTAEQTAQFASWRAGANKSWRDSIAKVQAGSWDEGLVWRRADAPTWTDEDVALSLAARFEVELDLFTYFPTTQSPWRDTVSQIDCPALLVVGDNKLGAIVSPEHAEEAAMLNPLLQWARIDAAGHAIRYDQFAAFRETAARFLDEVHDA